MVFPDSTVEAAGAVLTKVRTSVSHIEVVNGSRVSLPTRISVGIAAYRGYETRAT